MIEFPGEDSVVQELKEKCEIHFDLARRCLQLWLNIKKDKSLDKCNLPEEVVRVVVGLNIKICRLYRTAIELCQRGEAVGAAIIVRAMFEAVLATTFVLLPRFLPKEWKNGRLVKIPLPSRKRMTRKFRAELFFVHMVLSRKRLIDRIAVTRGLRNLGEQLKKKNDLKLIQKCENIIGNDWLRRLTKFPRTYSGLTISDLSRCMGYKLARWYDTIYSKQSDRVHSTDLDEFIVNDGKHIVPKWHSSLKITCAEMDIASAIFLHSLGTIHKYIKFGVAVNTALNALAKEHIEIGKKRSNRSK